MSRTLTASDRKRLIKLASKMPVGAPERKAVLAGLSKSGAYYHDKLQGFSKGDRVKFYRGVGTIKAIYRDRGIELADIRGDDDKFYEEVELAGLSKVAAKSGLQSKGLKAVKLASDSLFIPFLMPVRGGSKEVMPANGTDFTLREVQKMVGGYVEVVYLRDGRILLADEEGLLKGLPLNRAASRMAGRPIVGPALVMPNDMFR